MLKQSTSFLPIFFSRPSHQRIISISQQQIFLPYCKACRQLCHHCNMVTEPKIHFSKYQNSSDEPPKKTLSFLQLQLQHLLYHMYPSLFNIKGFQCHQSHLLYYRIVCLSHNQHHLIGCRRKSVHPNHGQSHHQFRTIILKKPKRKPKSQTHPIIFNNAHSVQ